MTDELPKIEQPKSKFSLVIPDWRTAFKMWSMRLNAVASAIIAYLIADPTFLFNVVGFMPEGRRVALALGIGVLVFILVAITRLVKQENLSATEAKQPPE